MDVWISIDVGSRACCVPSGSIPLSDGCDEYPAPSRLRTVSCDEDEKLSCTGLELVLLPVPWDV